MPRAAKPTMSDRAAALRAKAVSAGTAKQYLTLVLDPDLRGEMQALQDQLSKLRDRLEVLQLADEPEPTEAPASLSDEAPEKTEVGHMVTQCRGLIEQVEAALAAVKEQAEADDAVLRVAVRRCSPDRYRTLDEQARISALKAYAAYKKERDEADDDEIILPVDPDETYLFELGESLLAEGYVDCETTDGEALNIDLATLRADVLDEADLSELIGFAIGANKRGASVDFTPVSSGAPAQS